MNVLMEVRSFTSPILFYKVSKESLHKLLVVANLINLTLAYGDDIFWLHMLELDFFTFEMIDFKIFGILDF